MLHRTRNRNTNGVLAGLALAAALCVPAIAQDFPAPADEAALYEAAKAEGSVVWYSGGALETTKAVAAEFEKQYPGLTVDVLRLTGAQQYQRFAQETEAGQNIADILWLSDKPSMDALIESKDVITWRIPTYDRFADQYKIGESAYGFNRVDVAIVYNENAVTPEEATELQSDWKAVLDPKFKGRFAATTAKCGACYAALHMFLDPKLADQYPADFIQQIAAQQPDLYSDFLAMVDRVVAGEDDFAYWSFESIAATKRAQGAPIRWVYPNPTPSFASTWMAASAHAPHPNAARLFLNWAGSEAGAAAFQTKYLAATTIEGVPDQRPFTKEDWYQPMTHPYAVDFARWTANYETDLDSWIAALEASH